MSKTTKALVALGVVAGLGVAALPMCVGAASDSDTVTVRTTIGDTLSLEVKGDDDGESGHLVLLGDGVLQNNNSASGNATIKVATNHHAGYQVKMNGAGGFKMEGGVDADTEVFGDVAANTATFPTDGKSVFGYKTSLKSDVTNNNISFPNTNWNGVVDTAALIATGEGETTGDEFQIEFQAYADASQAAGTYSEVVTITAVTGV